MQALNISATGMMAQQRRTEVVANNLANMNTFGYQKRRVEFNDLLYKQESEKMTNYKNGLGIQKVILDQIYPKKFRNEQALAAFNAQSNAVGKKKFIRIRFNGIPKFL